MDDLTLFSFENKQVRITDRYGNPWFVGKDVCRILGYANASKALTDHVDTAGKLNNNSLSSLGQRGGWLINESGLYSLILASKLPEAKKFKRWITSEVLPAIYKTGRYSDTVKKVGCEEARLSRTERVFTLINKRNEIDQQIQEELKAENAELLEENKALMAKNERLSARVAKYLFRLKMIHESGRLNSKSLGKNK